MKTPSIKTGISLLCMAVVLIACKIDGKKTTMKITDPERHYYPILRGQPLDILYQIENTGSSPLFIQDIQTSCGCVLVDESSLKVLPSGGKGFIRLKYDSRKNIGYVKHYVTIYANIEDADRKEATFDVHVVTNALYTRDYEELHNERKEKAILDEETLVDGNENNLGYYVENHPW